MQKETVGNWNIFWDGVWLNFNEILRWSKISTVYRFILELCWHKWQYWVKTSAAVCWMSWSKHIAFSIPCLYIIYAVNVLFENSTNINYYIHEFYFCYKVAFKGRKPVKVVNLWEIKEIIKEVNAFNYLGNLIVYEKEMDIDNRLNNYCKITDIIDSTFIRQKTLKKTRITLYNTIDLPALLYNSENWAIKATDARRITTAGTKYILKNSRIHLDRL